MRCRGAKSCLSYVWKFRDPLKDMSIKSTSLRWKGIHFSTLRYGYLEILLRINSWNTNIRGKRINFVNLKVWKFIYPLRINQWKVRLRWKGKKLSTLRYENFDILLSINSWKDNLRCKVKKFIHLMVYKFWRPWLEDLDNFNTLSWRCDCLKDFN